LHTYHQALGLGGVLPEVRGAKPGNREAWGIVDNKRKEDEGWGRLVRRTSNTGPKKQEN
jgi:hypothetical protein